MKFEDKAKLFIAEVRALCVKYDLNIGHEDTQGAFEIAPIFLAKDGWDFDSWFGSAHIIHPDREEEEKS